MSDSGRRATMSPMNSSVHTSRFMLVPESREAPRGAERPKVRRYRLTRLGETGVPMARAGRFEHLRCMHD